MYELIQVAENSFYMDCPTKVGFFRTSPTEVVLFDSGSDKDAAKKVKRILDAQGWQLKAIFNTHSHADHIGGNRYLQDLTGCPVYAPGMERAFTEFPVLEPTMLYGAYHLKELENKFLLAKESRVLPLTEDVLPAGVKMIPLPGHCYDMVGFETPDNVIYLADCLSSAETLEKYKISVIFDVQSYLETLEMVKGLSARAFVPAHAACTEEIAPLAQYNIDQVHRIIDCLKTFLQESVTFEDLLAKVFTHFNLVMNLQQHLLVGATIRSYLSYLARKGEAGYTFRDNHMEWHLL